MLFGHLSDIFTLIGDVLIAYAVFSVHESINHEHRIDAKVSSSITREKKLILIGVIMLLLGFVFRILERIST